MKLVISAAPMYEDGSMGEDRENEFSVYDHVGIGSWLAAQAVDMIGTRDDDDSLCDAMDVTVTISESPTRDFWARAKE